MSRKCIVRRTCKQGSEPDTFYNLPGAPWTTNPYEACGFDSKIAAEKYLELYISRNDNRYRYSIEPVHSY